MASTWEEIVAARNKVPLNDPSNYHAPQQGGPLGLLGSWMSKNTANHPIYGNVGPSGLATELRQDSLLGGPGGQAHTPEGRAAMQHRTRGGRRGNTMPDFLASAVPAVQAVQNETQAVLQQKAANSATTIGELHEIQVTAKKKAQQEAHNAIYEESKAQLEAKGASEEQLKGWAKFADEVDLTTVGMALLASNDGSGNIVSNLGVALMMGREAASNRKSDQAAAEADLRKEDRAEREVARKESQTEADILAAENAAKMDLAKLGIQQQDAESKAAYRQGQLANSASSAAAAWANAYTNRMKAAAEGSGMEFKGNPQPATKAYVTSALNKLGFKPSEVEGLKEEEVVDIIASTAQTELDGNPDAVGKPVWVAEQAVKRFFKDYEDTGFMAGTNYTLKKKKDEQDKE